MYAVVIEKTESSARRAPCYCCGSLTHNRVALVQQRDDLTPKSKPVVLPQCYNCWTVQTYFVEAR